MIRGTVTLVTLSVAIATTAGTDLRAVDRLGLHGSQGRLSAAQIATSGSQATTVPRRTDDACIAPSEHIRVLEARAAENIQEDLMTLDGINENRDVLVIACSSQLRSHYLSDTPKTKVGTGSVLLQVRAWHKPKEGGWREIRLNEPSITATNKENLAPERIDVESIYVSIDERTPDNPIVTIPLRRESVKRDDLVRIRITVHVADPVKLLATEQNTAKEEVKPPSIQAEVRIIDSVFRVGRYGLHSAFSDAAVFVKRLGSYSTDQGIIGDSAFDSSSYRPSPALTYGLTVYDRRRAIFRFLEPGFGAHFALLDWTPRCFTEPCLSTRGGTVQVGIGAMGSMFDGTIVALYGWNLQASEPRSYFGIGFSFTGLIRKLSRNPAE